MADHKFEYIISGVELSNEQKATIASEIGAAVARALIGSAPKHARSEMLNICNIHGGRWVPAELVANQKVADVARV